MSQRLKHVVEPAKEYDIVVHACDVCGKDGILTTDIDEWGLEARVFTCKCGKDVCSNCSRYFGPESFMHHWDGLEAVYCKECYEDSKVYIDKIEDAAYKLDAYIEDVIEEWLGIVKVGEQGTPTNGASSVSRREAV